MTSYLTLLLATLGIMIGLFTVTGFINRMGAMLLDLGAWNIIAMIVMAWVFGWLAGAGLPPTATYIIGAVVIVRPMQELGINPWIAHFFVFLLSVWGELSPPTSLTAAVSARIANASFLQDHVRGAEDLRADHADDVRDLHPPQHGGEPGLAADRRHDAGADQHLRHHLRDVRALSRATAPSTLRCAACWRRSRSWRCSIPTCRCRRRSPWWWLAATGRSASGGTARSRRRRRRSPLLQVAGDRSGDLAPVLAEAKRDIG